MDLDSLAASFRQSYVPHTSNSLDSLWDAAVTFSQRVESGDEDDDEFEVSDQFAVRWLNRDSLTPSQASAKNTTRTGDTIRLRRRQQFLSLATIAEEAEAFLGHNEDSSDEESNDTEVYYEHRDVESNDALEVDQNDIISLKPPDTSSSKFDNVLQVLDEILQQSAFDVDGSTGTVQPPREVLVSISRARDTPSTPVKKKRSLLHKAKQQLRAKFSTNYLPIGKQIEGDTESTRVVKEKYVLPMLSRYCLKLRKWMSRSILMLRSHHKTLGLLQQQTDAEVRPLVKYGSKNLVEMLRAWQACRFKQIVSMAKLEELKLIVLRSRLLDVEERMAERSDKAQETTVDGEQKEKIHEHFFMAEEELYALYSLVEDERSRSRKLASEVRACRLQFEITKERVLKEDNSVRVFRLASVLDRAKAACGEDRSVLLEYDAELQSVFNTLVLDQRTKQGRQISHMVKRMGAEKAIYAKDVLQFVDNFTNAMAKQYNALDNVAQLHTFTSRALFPHVYELLFPGTERTATTNDVVELCLKWRCVSLVDHGVSDKHILALEDNVPEHTCVFPRALQHLQLCAQSTVPMDIAFHIQHTLSELREIMSQNSADGGADVLFPLFVHCVSHCDVKKLQNAAEFVDGFLDSRYNIGEISYCVTSLLAALVCLSREPKTTTKRSATTTPSSSTTSSTCTNSDVVYGKSDESVISVPVGGLPERPNSVALTESDIHVEKIPPVPFEEVNFAEDRSLSLSWRPSLTKETAEVFLKTQPVNSFVLRPSSQAKAFSLSYVDRDDRDEQQPQTVVRHARITFDEKRGYSLQGTDRADSTFPTIHDLLRVYGFL